MTTTNIGAGAMLDSAKKIVCQERTHQHGDTVESFKVIAEFWQTYLRAVNRGTDSIKVSVVDVAEMMSFVKKARFIFGDKADSENFVDDIGYVSIAGMFAGVKPAQAAAEPGPVAGLVNLNVMEHNMRKAAE